MNKKTVMTLMNLGIPASLKGFGYLADSIEMCQNDPQAIHLITKRLYPQVAKQNNTTASRVERAIRHAVEVCFNRISPDMITEYFGATVSYTKGKLTNSEFIAAVVQHLQFEEDKDEIKNTHEHTDAEVLQPGA